MWKHNQHNGYHKNENEVECLKITERYYISLISKNNLQINDT